MKQSRINPGPLPVKRGAVVVGNTPTSRRFSFSLEYWRQIEYFGLGDVPSRWFVSLLERLKQLSKLNLSLLETGEVEGLRIHEINWSAKNIPIALDDLSWIPENVRKNQTEAPLVQIHISKALGRIHGFWDSNSCFQIVLLDPMHNLQPSKYNDYVVRSTSIGTCELSTLRLAVDRACSKPCSDKECPLASAVREVSRHKTIDQNFLIAGISPQAAASLQKHSSMDGFSVSEVVEHGLIFWTESLKQAPIDSPQG